MEVRTITRGKSQIVLLSLYALVLSNAGYAGESPAELAKQAERLGIKNQFDQAEQVYMNIIQQAWEGGNPPIIDPYTWTY